MERNISDNNEHIHEKMTSYFFLFCTNLLKPKDISYLRLPSKKCLVDWYDQEIETKQHLLLAW